MDHAGECDRNEIKSLSRLQIHTPPPQEGVELQTWTNTSGFEWKLSDDDWAECTFVILAGYARARNGTAPFAHLTGSGRRANVRGKLPSNGQKFEIEDFPSFVVVSKLLERIVRGTIGGSWKDTVKTELRK